MPDPMRFLGWKAFERQLLIYEVPSGSIALANDLSVAETVLADRDGNFPKSAYLEAMLRPLIGSGVFGQPGGDAVRSRRKSYLKVLSKVSDAEVDQVARLLTKRYLAEWQAVGETVPVPREMSRLTIDIVTTVVFGDCFLQAESLRFVDLFFEYHKRCNPTVVFCTPGDAESAAGFIENVRLAEIGDEMRQLIHQRFIAPLLNGINSSVDRNSLLPAFVNSLLDEVGDIPQQELATLLLDEVSVMILAGHETSASVLSWLLWEVSGNPSLLADLRSLAPESEAYATALEALIQEGLRFYPPIAFYLRDVKETTEFRGKNLPAGSSIAISPWTIHRHKGVWEDLCPGKYFAEAELRAIFCELLNTVNLERVEGRDPLPLGKLTSRPDYDFCLRFTPRVCL
jgi:cytochrome P450